MNVTRLGPLQRRQLGGILKLRLDPLAPAVDGGAAMVLILTQSDRLKRGEQIGLWLLCVYAMAIHKSHFGTGAVMAVGGALLVWLLGLPAPRAARRGAVLLSALAVAGLMGAIADGAYELRTGYKLGHPPFVLARVLADGPGRDFMKAVCANGQQPFQVCKFQANVSADTNLILWSDRPKLGVFNIATFAERQKLEAEEGRFVIGTIRFAPIDQLESSLWDWAQQLVAYQVDDPLRNPSAYLRGRYWPTTALPKMIPTFEACRPPLDRRPPFNYELRADWHGAVLAASLLLLGWRLTRRDVREAVWRRRLGADDEAARLAAAVLLLLAAVIINAAICGVLSGPFARYQSRIIWLAPLGAGMTLCALPMGLGRLADRAMAVWAFGFARWEGLRAHPVFGRFLPALDGHFVRFCVVGLLGFVVDFTVLKVVVKLGVSPIGGRGLSFPVAVMVTWLANRAWTFQEQARQQSLLRELSTYFAVQSAGFAANFLVYTSMVAGIPALHGRLLPPMVAGTAAGLIINFLGAKHIVFRRRARAS